MEFSGEKLTFKRIFNYIFGLFLITLGVAFSIKSGLGSTPVASIPCIKSNIEHWFGDNNIHISNIFGNIAINTFKKEF